MSLTGCSLAELKPVFKAKTNINSPNLVLSLTICLLWSWPFNEADRPMKAVSKDLSWPLSVLSTLYWPHLTIVLGFCPWCHCELSWDLPRRERCAGCRTWGWELENPLPWLSCLAAFLSNPLALVKSQSLSPSSPEQLTPAGLALSENRGVAGWPGGPMLTLFCPSPGSTQTMSSLRAQIHTAKCP